MPTEILWSGPERAPGTLVLAHGAGGAMDSAGMNELAGALAERGVRTARFEFAYMAARRDGARRPPPRAETLIGEYRAVVEQLAGRPLFIGGRSMGGRVATMLADEADVGGVVCFGYPFHPPGRPEQLRTAHLERLRTPLLICQGTRDQFGSREEVADYPLSPAIELLWLEDGDHGLRPRAAISGFTYKEHLATAAAAAAGFIQG